MGQNANVWPSPRPVAAKSNTRVRLAAARIAGSTGPSIRAATVNAVASAPAHSTPN